MIYKIKFDDGRIDFCTAQNIVHLIKTYDDLYDFPIQELESIDEISEEEAKTIEVRNRDYDEEDLDDQELFPLSHYVNGDDFEMIASSIYD